MKDPETTQQDPEQELDERLPYEPPAVISEDVFETLALSCANVEPTCSLQPKS